MRFCDALWGAVVGREPEFEVTSQIRDVISNFVLGGANSVSLRYNSLRGFRSWGDRIRSSQNEIRDDVTDLWSHLEFRFTSNYCTPKCITEPHRRLYQELILKISFLSSLRLRELWFLSLAVFLTAFRAKTKFTLTVSHLIFKKTRNIYNICIYGSSY